MFCFCLDNFLYSFTFVISTSAPLKCFWHTHLYFPLSDFKQRRCYELKILYMPNLFGFIFCFTNFLFPELNALSMISYNLQYESFAFAQIIWLQSFIWSISENVHVFSKTHMLHLFIFDISFYLFLLLIVVIYCFFLNESNALQIEYKCIQYNKFFTVSRNLKLIHEWRLWKVITNFS